MLTFWNLPVSENSYTVSFLILSFVWFERCATFCESELNIEVSIIIYSDTICIKLSIPDPIYMHYGIYILTTI